EFIEDAISTVDNSVRRMSRLLEQLRHGGSPDLTRRVKVTQLCEEVAEQCGQRRPKVTVYSEEPEAEIRASRDGLAAVFGHVIRNAQDAAGADGEVSIKISRQDADVVVEVLDNGSGMDEYFIRERLFRPFESTKGSKGMGIGAYQAREFVRAAGGDVEVDSTLGQGTVFRLIFPLAQSVQQGVARKTGAIR
ncbi:MAG: HAMP domain-containing histidine kinase, partial [Gammaproteobacteria bacterium]|nr:HAMP domain-containing histidine kinase [Gammaproteobacteria bacterium]